MSWGQKPLQTETRLQPRQPVPEPSQFGLSWSLLLPSRPAVQFLAALMSVITSLVNGELVSLDVPVKEGQLNSTGRNAGEKRRRESMPQIVSLLGVAGA